MSFFEVTALFLVLAALISYLNERVLKLPGKTGHFLLGIAFSLFLFICEFILPVPIHGILIDFIHQASFSDILIEGMLGVLLFASGLHTPLGCLEQNRRSILALAVIATFLNVFLVSGMIWGLGQILPFNIPFLHALIFGALISPTDPLSAMAILKKIGMPESLETIFVGESLFNDGIGLVLFTIFVSLAAGGHDISVWEGARLFAVEVIGGHVVGFALFGLAHYLIKTSEDFYTQTLVTVAAVAGGYALCLALHVSGPIAMAVFGLFLGSYTLKSGMDRSERHDAHMFWTVIDDIFNAVLFILIGLQFARLTLRAESIIALLVVIPIVLLARFTSVLAALNALFISTPLSRQQIGIVALLSWGGLRGGLSIAMAFTLAPDMSKSLILDMTFGVVAFSILVQGLSLSRIFSKKQLQSISRNITRGQKND